MTLHQIALGIGYFYLATLLIFIFLIILTTIWQESYAALTQPAIPQAVGGEPVLAERGSLRPLSFTQPASKGFNRRVH